MSAPLARVAGRYTAADTEYPSRALVGPAAAGQTSAWLLSVLPHGHGLPVHVQVTSCELPANPRGPASATAAGWPDAVLAGAAAGLAGSGWQPPAATAPSSRSALPRSAAGRPVLRGAMFARRQYKPITAPVSAAMLTARAVPA